MKIAVYHELPSGGAKRALYEMIKRLAQDHDITLFTHKSSEKFLDISEYVDTIEWVPEVVHPSSKFEKLSNAILQTTLRKYDRQQRQLARRIDAASFDVLFVHPSASIQSPSLLHYVSTPSVYYSQEIRRSWYEYRVREQSLGSGPQRPILKRNAAAIAKLDDRNIRSAHSVLVNSYHSKEAHKRAYGIEATVVYLGIDTSHFTASAREKPRTSGVDELLCVGAMEPFKNQTALLPAVKLLEDGGLGGEIRVRYVFDRQETEYRKKVQGHAKELGVNVQFTEKLSEDELRESYRRASVTACLADLEPFGFTPLESVACGTPVVALREGGYRETVVSGENGFFSDSLLPHDIAQALRSALSKNWDSKKLHHSVAQHWSWDTTTAYIAQALQQAADDASL